MELGEPFEIAKETPVNVFVLSDGQITWGEAEAATLVARFERLIGGEALEVAARRAEGA